MLSFDPSQTAPLCAAMLPTVLMMIEDDQDRAFIEELYLRYRPVLYKTALRYFGPNEQELEDAIGKSIERMCKYCHTLKRIPPEKQPIYLVCIARSVCHTRMTYLRTHDLPDFLALEEAEEEVPLLEEEVVFSRFYAMDLLQSFNQLTERDKELIRLRHIDQMDYDEIASVLHISPGAARTAVCRAKSRLEKLAATFRKGDWQ